MGYPCNRGHPRPFGDGAVFGPTNRGGPARHFPRGERADTVDHSARQSDSLVDLTDICSRTRAVMPGEIAEAEPSRQRIVLRVCGAYLESMLLHACFDSAAKAVVECSRHRGGVKLSARRNLPRPGQDSSASSSRSFGHSQDDRSDHSQTLTPLPPETRECYYGAVGRLGRWRRFWAGLRSPHSDIGRCHGVKRYFPCLTGDLPRTPVPRTNTRTAEPRGFLLCHLMLRT
jgi:hypothetical protein